MANNFRVSHILTTFCQVISGAFSRVKKKQNMKNEENVENFYVRDKYLISDIKISAFC